MHAPYALPASDSGPRSLENLWARLLARPHLSGHTIALEKVAKAKQHGTVWTLVPDRIIIKSRIAVFEEGCSTVWIRLHRLLGTLILAELWISTVIGSCWALQRKMVNGQTLFADLTEDSSQMKKVNSPVVKWSEFDRPSKRYLEYVHPSHRFTEKYQYASRLTTSKTVCLRAQFRIRTQSSTIDQYR